MTDNIEQHRKYLLGFMKEFGLNSNKWAKIANISEGTLRAYLVGRSQNISLDTLYKLAGAISVPVIELIEETSSAINEVNFYKSVVEIDQLLEKKKMEISPENRAKLYLSWYRVLNSLKGESQELNSLLKDLIDLKLD